MQTVISRVQDSIPSIGPQLGTIGTYVLLFLGTWFTAQYAGWLRKKRVNSDINPLSRAISEFIGSWRFIISSLSGTLMIFLFILEPTNITGLVMGLAGLDPILWANTTFLAGVFLDLPLGTAVLVAGFTLVVLFLVRGVRAYP